MNMLKITAVASFSILVQACSMSPKPSSFPLIALDITDTKLQALTLQGTVGINVEEQIFTPCNGYTPFKLDISPAVAEKISLTSDKTIYGTLTGYFNPPKPTESDAYYQASFVVQDMVVLDDGEAKTCKRDFNVSIWSAHYQSDAKLNHSYSVRLEINPDHTASTYYDYANGDESTIERGYWQSLNDKQIQVVMTRHQQQYLLSERIFTRDGNKITALKEKIGRQIYPITNDGLILYKK